VPAALPRGACGLTFVLLLIAVQLQRLDAAGGEGDAAFGGPGHGHGKHVRTRPCGG
jgi:hypothetical protein